MAASRSKSKRKGRPDATAKPVKSAKPKHVTANAKRKSATPAKPARKGKAKVADQSAVARDDKGAVAPSLYQLPERLDSSTAASVLAEFKAHRGRMIVVDASQVRRVGAQPLQILVSAARTWKSDGLSFSVLNPSDELIEVAALLGLPASEFSISGQWQ